MKVIRDWGRKSLTRLNGKKGLWLALLSVLILAGGSAWWLLKQGNDKSSEVQYEEVKVQKDDIIVGLDSDGTINFSKVNLRFDVKGTIAEILVAQGDEV